MYVPAPEHAGQIVAWLERELGGRVVEIKQQPRWRPVWFADVERDGETMELCVRAERSDMPLIFPLEHEMRFKSLLEERGIPVAAVHGMIDTPHAYVMDRVRGQEHFPDTPDEERASAVDDYLGHLARLHALDPEPFAAAGIVRAKGPAASGTVGLARYEEVYRSQKAHPDPFLEFCLGWLRRNPPDSKGREAPIVWDSGQFHHADGKIVALLDLEIGHIGDPMMDLAAWRMRDTIVGYGDMTKLYARYEELRGEPIDIEAIAHHHFVFTLTHQLAFSAHQPVGVQRCDQRAARHLGSHDQPAIVCRNQPLRHRSTRRDASDRVAWRRHARTERLLRRDRPSTPGGPAALSTDRRCGATSPIPHRF